MGGTGLDEADTNGADYDLFVDSAEFLIDINFICC